MPDPGLGESALLRGRDEIIALRHAGGGDKRRPISISPRIIIAKIIITIIIAIIIVTIIIMSIIIIIIIIITVIITIIRGPDRVSS